MSHYQDAETLADFGLHPLTTPLHQPSTIEPSDYILPSHPSPPPISDPDHFLSSLYTYYHKKGLWPIISSGIVDLITLFFTLYLSYVIGICIDWQALTTCHDETSCHDTYVEYWISNPFTSDEYHSFGKKLWIGIYCLLFTIYGVVCVVQFGYLVLAMLESKSFLEEVLAVSPDDLTLGSVDWNEIVERMERRGDVMRNPWMGGGNDATTRNKTGPLMVAQRIMRRENYMVAFFNLGLLDLTLPDFDFTRVQEWIPYPMQRWMEHCHFFSRRNDNNKDESPKKMIFYSKSIEWSIYFCILNYMFNHSRKIRPAFYGDASSLRKRFILCGVAHFIFMPFLVFFVTLHFFMVNVYEWQSTKEYLGPREWGEVAKWKFWEFNELPHLFERRLEPSYKHASNYLEMFSKPSALSIATGRLLVFISGSLGTLLLALAAINDAILLHVKIGSWNLLWYAGVLGAAFSIGKSLLPKATNPYCGYYRRNLSMDMNAELEKIATHTHYFPEEWRGRACDDATKKAFSEMFQFKAAHFAREILSIVVAPLILCISLPRSADGLCNFVRDSKVEVPGAGEVVGYSTFDFDVFEDENWAGKGTLDEASWGESNSQRGGRERKLKNGRPKSKHGKMEKSFFTFKSAYPNWKLPPSGKNLVDMVETYRQQQESALAHERRLHIQAAAAQLLTLQKLEQERERRSSSQSLSRIIDDNHVKLAAADSGGGSPENFRHDSTQSDFSSMASFNDDLHHPTVHFEDSVHSFAPPTRAFAHSSLYQRRPRDVTSITPRHASSSPRDGDVMHYTDAGLSMELRGLLDRSSLVDPSSSGLFGGSFTGSLVPVEDGAASILDMRTDQQYSLLDQYHSEAERSSHRLENRPRDSRQGELS